MEKIYDARLKKYRDKVDKLQKTVYEMKHYWKVRCHERLSYRNKLLHLSNILKHVEHLEDMLGTMAVKSQKNSKGIKTYFLRLSHNDCSRLRLFIINNLHNNRFVKHVKGKTVPHLTTDQRGKLFELLKRNKRVMGGENEIIKTENVA
jgi:hypothetical protein